MCHILKFCLVFTCEWNFKDICRTDRDDLHTTCVDTKTSNSIFENIQLWGKLCHFLKKKNAKERILVVVNCVVSGISRLFLFLQLTSKKKWTCREHKCCERKRNNFVTRIESKFSLSNPPKREFQILFSIVPKKVHQENARKQFSQWDSPLTIHCFENMIIWGNKMLKKWEADDIFRKSTAKNVIALTFSEKMVHCQHKFLSK